MYIKLDLHLPSKILCADVYHLIVLTRSKTKQDILK